MIKKKKKKQNRTIVIYTQEEFDHGSVDAYL